MDNNPANRDEVVSQFCAMTSIDPGQAQEYLAANGWDIEAAVTEFFAEQDEELQEENLGHGQHFGTEGESAGSSGQTLGSGAAASSSGGQSSRNRPANRIATLSDYASGRGESPEDDDDDQVNQDFFAGGEKSGLAVQNPDDLKKKIIEKASRTQRPSSDDPQPRQSHFTGTARTLGGDDAPSRVIESASAPAARQLPQKVLRTLHFWADGFSVDDGDLYRSDDPRNAEILEGIRQGHAPLSIMNVQKGQEVDVEIKQHDEKYVKPKPKFQPFSGQGIRLGSPTPGVSSTAPSATPADAPSQAGSEAPKPDVDESQPVVTLQIRLGDGTRLTSRFNTSHTIGDVYGFVMAASPISQSRPWALMTTFPSKELTDKGVALGELAEFKRGGVVVQKWK